MKKAISKQYKIGVVGQWTGEDDDELVTELKQLGYTTRVQVGELKPQVDRRLVVVGGGIYEQVALEPGQIVAIHPDRGLWAIYPETLKEDFDLVE
jgi:hypothetical protein